MQNKVALVTGSASGIGLAAAEALRAAGLTVYASARRAESRRDLEQQGFLTLQLDVTDDASVQAAVAHITAQHGAVDVLVNNAGYGQNGPLEALAISDVRRQFETNVFGLVRLTQLVLPGMRRKGWGRVINVGSIGGTFSTPRRGGLPRQQVRGRGPVGLAAGRGQGVRDRRGAHSADRGLHLVRSEVLADLPRSSAGKPLQLFYRESRSSRHPNL